MKRLYFLFFAAVLLFVYASQAGAAYIVKKGDTLQKISKKHNISVSDIKQANNIKSSRLSTGMKLVIPHRNNDRAKKGSSKRDGYNGKSTVQVSSHKNTGSESVYHFVKKGDTLKTIAEKYSISAGELARVNNLSTTRLKVGQQLLIKSAAPKTYVVKKGDNLYRISRKFDMSVAELKEINNLETIALKPGQEIMLVKKAVEDKKDDISTPVTLAVEKKTAGPAVSSEKLEEVKAMSKSEDILSELTIKQRLILFAKKMLHLPYRFGGTGSFGMDCSAYVQKAYGFIGKDIPRSAREQFHQGESIDRKDLSTGDLVFFKTYASFPSHVGIYLGNNLFIHASSLSKKVTIDSLETPYYFKRFIGAKRLIIEDNAEPDEMPAVSSN